MMIKMKAALLTIGNEILEGIIVNTNSAWLARRLTALGVIVDLELTIRDDLAEQKYWFNWLKKNKFDVVISTGGLGPTHDDMTLQGFAEAFGLKLEINPEAYKIVARQYRKFYEQGLLDSPKMTESRTKMARIPIGSIPLDNKVGGAPGVQMKIDNTTFFILPGVPGEMKSIFEESVVPWIKENSEGVYYQKIVEFPTIDETGFSKFEKVAMKKEPRAYIKSMPKVYGTVKTLRVWVSSRQSSLEEAKEAVERAIAALEEASNMKSSEVSE